MASLKMRRGKMIKSLPRPLFFRVNSETSCDSCNSAESMKGKRTHGRDADEDMVRQCVRDLPVRHVPVPQ